MSAHGERSTFKIVLIVGLFLAAGLVFYLWGGSGDPSEESVLKAVEGKTYELSCAACNKRFDMPAEEYVSLLGETSAGSGVPCRRCGAQSAWLLGAARPPMTEADVGVSDDLSTRSGVESAMRTIDDQRQEASAELTAAREANDAERIKDAEAAYTEIDRKFQFLNDRWDELAMRQ